MVTERPFVKEDIKEYLENGRVGKEV